MPAWQSLLADAGRPDLLREQGHFVVWETPASAAAGLATWRATDIGTARFREADRSELDQLATLMRKPPAGAIRFENTGQIADLPRLAEALLAKLLAGGGELIQGKVKALALENKMASALLEGGERISGDIVLIAAGVRSRALLEPFGVRVPLIAERGYHLQMSEHRWPDLPPVVFEDRSMIVTRFDSGLRAASFVEFSSVDSPPDPRKWHRLRSHVTALGLPCGAPANEWMGARPTLPDYLPAIGRSHLARNLLYAFGHQHLGLTLAAVTSELVAQLAVRAEPFIDLQPFDIKRFRRM
jgi:D-amino-acid dehydrogenase